MSIRLEALKLSLPGFDLDVDLEARAGEWTSILGPSGSGKTTILRLIAGFIAPGSGRILRDGADIGALPPERRGFGFVFQDQALFPHQTVRGNVEFGLRARGLPRAERIRRAEDAMDTCALGGLEDRAIDGLSGGERQRVAIARAIAIEPGALLLDEPLASTDASLRRDLRLILRGVQRRRGISVIGVTHDQDEALAGSDRIILLDRGRVAQAGTPEELWREPANAFAARFVGMANLLPLIEARVADGRVTARTERFSVELPAGANLPGEGRGGAFLFIRADKLRPLDGDGASPRIEARILDCEFRGSRYLLRCESGGSELFSESMRPAKVGESIVLGFDPSDARLVGDFNRAGK